MATTHPGARRRIRLLFVGIGLLLVACDAKPGSGYNTPTSGPLPSYRPFAYHYGSSCMRGGRILDACAQAQGYTQATLNVNGMRVLSATQVDVVGHFARALSAIEVQGDISAAQDGTLLVVGSDFGLLRRSATQMTLEGRGAHRGWNLIATFARLKNGHTLENTALMVPAP